MVRISSIEEFEVKIDPCVGPQGFKKVFHEFRIQITQVLSRDLRFEECIGAAGEINTAAHQGLIHGDVGVPVPGQSYFTSHGLRKRLTQCDPYVFDGMVSVDVKVTPAPQIKVK
jgi:hypothetical protein